MRRCSRPRVRSPAGSRPADGRSRRRPAHRHRRSSKPLRLAAAARSTNSCTPGNVSASAAVRPCRSQPGCPTAGAGARARPPRAAAPAGRQDVHARCGGGHVLGHRGGGFDHVLATVEHQQHLPVAEMGEQAGHPVVRWNRQSEHRGKCARQQRGVADRRQVEKRYTIAIGQPRVSRATATATVVLPMPPGPTSVMKPALRQLRASTPRRSARGRSRGSAMPAGGRPAWSSDLGNLRPACCDTLIGRHEAITAAGIGDDVAVAVLTVAQRPSQQGDVDAQIGLIDERVRPDAGDQLRPCAPVRRRVPPARSGYPSRGCPERPACRPSRRSC